MPALCIQCEHALVLRPFVHSLFMLRYAEVQHGNVDELCVYVRLCAPCAAFWHVAADIKYVFSLLLSKYIIS